MTRRAPPPPDLATGGRGRRLWRDLLGVYTFAPVELVLVHELCRSVDQIDACLTLIDRDGLVVAGSKGQVVDHPLLSEVRANRALAARIASQLDLPEVVPDALPGTGSDRVTSLTSIRARRAARSRWDRRGVAG